MAGSFTSPALHALVTSSNIGTVPDESSSLSHHVKDGKGFVNPWPSYVEQSGPAIGRAMIWRMLSGRANKPDTTPPTVPVQHPDFLPTRQTPALRATWLGHACYYVEFPSGLRVLFDPVFTCRCSPFSWLGPKRYTEMPCDIDAIPFIDVVVISHSHYDHLSLPTVKKIQKNHPNVHFLAPLGNKTWFESCGITNMTELDWWHSVNVELSPASSSASSADEDATVKVQDPETRLSSTESSNISAVIGCLPCQHTSGRTPFDKGRSLWGSWSVESGGKKLWFGGDTGYRSVPQLPDDVDDYAADLDFPHCPAFKDIGALRGPFDLGLIPIGAYEPRYIMSPMHANPVDAVNIFVDTKCKNALGIHWGTWVLTEEDVLEPPKLLKKALAEKSIPQQGVFDVCDIGASREYS